MIYGLRAANGCYVCAEGGGGMHLVADRRQMSAWERFEFTDPGGGVVTMRAHNGQYVCAEPNGAVIANRDVADLWEQFWIVHVDRQHIAVRSHHGRFVGADLDASAILFADRERVSARETFELVAG